jgi:hypothetical protein
LDGTVFQPESDSRIEAKRDSTAFRKPLKARRLCGQLFGVGLAVISTTARATKKSENVRARASYRKRKNAAGGGIDEPRIIPADGRMRTMEVMICETVPTTS